MWRVLLADDEPFVREGLKELIPWEELGCELLGAYKNGKELLDDIPLKRPDLVVLDIKMPVMDGLEAARIISEEYHQVQVVLLTAYAEFQYAQQAITYGVQRYVMKRNVLDDLPEVLKDMGKKIKQAGSVEKKEQAFLRLLLHESEFKELLIEESSGYYERYAKKFEEFRLLVIQGYKEAGESRSAIKERMLLEIQKIFPAQYEEGRILSVSITEYIILLSGDETEDNLQEKCRRLSVSCNSDEQNILIGIGKVYQGIENISPAYKLVLNYLSTHFQDWEENNSDVVWVGELSKTVGGKLPVIVGCLVEAMETGNGTLCVDELQNFRYEVRNSTEICVRSAFFLLLAECRRICHEYGWELSTVIGIGEAEIDTKILKISLSELEDWMEKSILAVMDQMRKGMDSADDLVKRTRKFVEKNYCRKLTLDEIAGAVYANCSYLSRLYKKKTGENLFDTINRKRVETAKQLIAKGEKKIFEIAAMVGVDDTAYFSKVFRKYTGYSPKEYERITREESEG